MDYIVNHIPIGKLRPGDTIIPQYITIHSTGNPTSTAQNERAWLTNPANDRIASYHIVVDDKEAIEVIPLWERAHHARGGNYNSIGVEICESGDRETTIANAITVITNLLRQWGWGVDCLRRHYDWDKTAICPRILSANNWAGWHSFVDSVRNKLEVSDWARESWEWGIKEGITDGSNPKGIPTREQVVAMIYRSVRK